MTKKSDILTSSEYIKNVLYFAIVKEGKVLIDTENTHYFCIDDELVYENYFSDFGPLNLGCVFLYCKKLSGKIRQYLNKQIIVHYTSSDPKKKANSAFLLGCYGVLYLSLPPEEALRPLLMQGQIYRPFQDAVKGDSIYTISLLDCLQAMKKARDLGFFNFQDFNYEAYSKFEKTSDGDLSWIIPGKFLAFMGPIDNQHSFYHQPETYIDYFLENNVGMVIRLNKRLYDETKFTNYGIMHQDLIFPDGTCPPKNILFKFLQLSEEYDFAIAVHCKAGLGRTGSLIGCYLIKHYRMTAHEAIGWMRICRPGSVISDQQHWLEQLESWLIKQGNLYRKRLYKDPDRLPVHEYGIYSSLKRSTQSSAADSSHLSPLPRKNIPNLTPPPRPRNSRVREVLYKKNEEDQCEWCSNYNFKINSGQRSPTRGDSNRTREVMGRTSNASGEPRIVRSLSRGSSSQAKGRSTDSNCAQVSFSPNRNYYNSTATMTPKYSDFKNSTVVNTVKEAKTLLSSSTFSRQNRLGELSSVIRVTPHKMPVLIKTKVPGKIPSISKFVLSSGSRESSLPHNRRRLGRSPSPSPTRQRQRPLEQTRATNTNPIEMNLKSHSNIREALSRLKCKLKNV